ncbi:MAG TPA: alpha/beta fold hydrolase [Candidatus Eisenbacteria bacterium]|nr:alpha/beta fold hydrolase [Candidatus Eisenbacteria bacterium]
MRRGARVVLAAALLAAALPTAAPGRASAALEWMPDTLMTFEKTTRSVERGVLPVAQDRSKPEGPQVQLGFLRYRATGKSPGPPVVFIAGLSGIPASFVSRIPAYDRLFQRLRATGDVILFDQRGIGISGPLLLCLPSHPLSPEVFASEANARKEIDEAFGWCAGTLRANGLDAAAYDVRSSAEDLEALRQALGAPRLNLFAYSIGTELAQEYLRRWSDHVGRAVLVGARGTDEAWRLPSVFDTYVRRLSRFVALDSTYAKRLPDAEAAIRSAVASLDAHPRTLSVVDRRSGSTVELKAGGFALQMLLQGDLIDPLGFSTLPALLVTLAEGDDFLFAKKLGQLYNNLSNVINVQVVASECASGADAGRAERIAREAASSPFGGARSFLQRPELCKAVGAADLGPEYRDRVYSLVPTLFLSGANDGNAPPFQAEEVRWGFPNGIHLVVANGWHDLLPVPDVQQAIVDFLAGQEVGGRRLVAPPIRFLPVDVAKSTYGKGR